MTIAVHSYVGSTILEYMYMSRRKGELPSGRQQVDTARASHRPERRAPKGLPKTECDPHVRPKPHTYAETGAPNQRILPGHTRQ